VVTLHRYILRGRLYIYGGAVIGFGLLAVLVEFLLTITFTMPPLFTWSLYPLTVFTLLGNALLATAVFRPLREALEKKLFI
jgi:heme/copper-type cytochrome/quinol oxidase subunit 1